MRGTKRPELTRREPASIDHPFPPFPPLHILGEWSTASRSPSRIRASLPTQRSDIRRESRRRTWNDKGTVPEQHEA